MVQQLQEKLFFSLTTDFKTKYFDNNYKVNNYF